MEIAALGAGFIALALFLLFLGACWADAQMGAAA